MLPLKNYAVFITLALSLGLAADQFVSAASYDPTLYITSPDTAFALVPGTSTIAPNGFKPVIANGADMAEGMLFSRLKTHCENAMTCVFSLHALTRYNEASANIKDRAIMVLTLQPRDLFISHIAPEFYALSCTSYNGDKIVRFAHSQGKAPPPKKLWVDNRTDNHLVFVFKVNTKPRAFAIAPHTQKELGQDFYTRFCQDSENCSATLYFGTPKPAPAPKPKTLQPIQPAPPSTKKARFAWVKDAPDKALQPAKSQKPKLKAPKLSKAPKPSVLDRFTLNDKLTDIFFARLVTLRTAQFPSHVTLCASSQGSARLIVR